MWKKFTDSFHGSETIILARVNLALGSIYAGVQFLDLTAFNIDKKWVVVWAVANGALGEFLRRRRAEYDDDGKMR